MNDPKKNRLQFNMFFLPALAGFLALLILVLIPGDSKNARFLGFSRTRLIMLASLVGFVLTSLLMLLAYNKGDRWQDRVDTLRKTILSDKTSTLSLFYAATFIFTLSLHLIGTLLTTTDQSLNGILLRLFPYIFIITAICMQNIIWLQRSVTNNKKNYAGGLFVFVLAILTLEGISLNYLKLLAPIVVFLSMLEVLLFALLIAKLSPLNKIFGNWSHGLILAFLLSLFIKTQYLFVPRNYDPTLLLHAPLIVLILGLIATLVYLVESKVKLRLHRFSVLFAFLILAALFYQGASQYAQTMNTEITFSDQRANVNFARKAKETNFQYLGNRNQTPLYPFLQALFIDTDAGETAQFSHGKQVNIVLSLLILTVAFFVARRYLPYFESIVFTLVLAFSLYIFKAPHFQTEPLYYFISFVGFILLAVMIETPTIKLGIITGLVSGVAYLAKASFLPALLAFAVAYGLKMVFSPEFKQVFAKNLDKPWLNKVFAFVLLFVFFFATTGFYLRENKKIYDNYFYNVNSAYFMWFDDWFTARDTVFPDGPNDLAPSFAAGEQPGPAKYLREHSPQEIMVRIATGLSDQYMFITNPYGRYSYLLIYGFAAGLFALLGGKHTITVIKSYRYVLLFAAFFFFGYVLVFSWWTYLAGGWNGPRFFYSIYLPLVFAFFIALRKLSTSVKEFPLLKTRIQSAALLKAINLLVLLLIFIDVNYYVFEKLIFSGTWYGK